MPFDADDQYQKLTRLLGAVETIQWEMTDSVTLDEAWDESERCREESEWLYDDVKPFREADSLSKSEKSELVSLEREMERLYDRHEKLRRAVDRLAGEGLDMEQPVNEIESDLKDERRRVKKYQRAHA